MTAPPPLRWFFFNFEDHPQNASEESWAFHHDNFHRSLPPWASPATGAAHTDHKYTCDHKHKPQGAEKRHDNAHPEGYGDYRQGIGLVSKSSRPAAPHRFPSHRSVLCTPYYAKLGERVHWPPFLHNKIRTPAKQDKVFGIFHRKVVSIPSIITQQKSFASIYYAWERCRIYSPNKEIFYIFIHKICYIFVIMSYIICTKIIVLYELHKISLTC